MTVYVSQLFPHFVNLEMIEQPLSHVNVYLKFQNFHYKKRRKERRREDLEINVYTISTDMEGIENKNLYNG